MHLVLLGLLSLTEDYNVRISWDCLLSYFECDQMQALSENEFFVDDMYVLMLSFSPWMVQEI